MNPETSQFEPCTNHNLVLLHLHKPSESPLVKAYIWWYSVVFSFPTCGWDVCGGLFLFQCSSPPSYRVTRRDLRETMACQDSEAHLDHRYPITHTWEPWPSLSSRLTFSLLSVFQGPPGIAGLPVSTTHASLTSTPLHFRGKYHCPTNISVCRCCRPISACWRFIGISVYVLWYALILKLLLKATKFAWSHDENDAMTQFIQQRAVHYLIIYKWSVSCSVHWCLE